MWHKPLMNWGGWDGKGKALRWGRGVPNPIGSIQMSFQRSASQQRWPANDLVSLDSGGLRGHSLISAREQTAQRQDGRWIMGGEWRKDGRKGKEHRRGLRRLSPHCLSLSTTELPSAWVKSWFDLNPITKLLKHLFAFLIWAGATRKMATAPFPNHLSIACAAFSFRPKATRVSFLSSWITAKMQPDRNLIEKSSWTAPLLSMWRHWWMIDGQNTKRRLKDRAPASSNRYPSLLHLTPSAPPLSPSLSRSPPICLWTCHHGNLTPGAEEEGFALVQTNKHPRAHLWWFV